MRRLYAQSGRRRAGRVRGRRAGLRRDRRRRRHRARVIADEVRALHAAGMPAEAALAAASWGARDWLGLPCIEEGAPADLVVYDTDPARRSRHAAGDRSGCVLRRARRRLDGRAEFQGDRVPAADDASIRRPPPEASAVRRAMSRPRPVDPAAAAPALDRGRVGHPGPASAHRRRRHRRRPAAGRRRANAVPVRGVGEDVAEQGVHRRRQVRRRRPGRAAAPVGQVDGDRAPLLLGEHATRSAPGRPTTAVASQPAPRPSRTGPPGLGDHLVDARGSPRPRRPASRSRSAGRQRPRRRGAARSAACAAGARGRRRTRARPPAARRSVRPAG